MKRSYMSEEDIKRFNSYMAAAGHNITSLSKEIHMARPTLSSKVNGKTDFSKSEMEKIGVALHENPINIFFCSDVTLNETSEKYVPPNELFKNDM